MSSFLLRLSSVRRPGGPAPAPPAAQWPLPPDWYVPPTGLAFNPATGVFDGTNITTPFVAPSTEETFTDTGNASTNMTNLQNLLNSWAGSSTRKRLIVPAGTQFNGSLQLPRNAGSGWTELVVSGYSVPSGPPTSGSGLAIIEAQGVTFPAIYTPSTGSGTTGGRYAFRGFEIRFAASLGTGGADTGPTSIVRLGDSSVSSYANQPDGFYFEGCWIHGWAANHCRRGIEWHCSNLHVYRCNISEIHNKKRTPVGGGDSQCIWGWNGSGPLLVDETWMSGGDESFGTGGAVPATGGVPCDQHYRKCWTDKPASMLTGDWATKNHAEWKFAKRVLVEGCVHTGFPTYSDNAQQTVYGLKVQLNGAFPNAEFENFLSYNCMSDRVPQVAYFVADSGFTLRKMAIVNFLAARCNEDGDGASAAGTTGSPNAVLLAWNSGNMADAHFDHITCVTNSGETSDGALRLVAGGSTTLTNLTLKNILCECNGTSPSGWGGIASSFGQGDAAIAAKCAGTIITDKVWFIGTGSMGSEPAQLSGYPTGCAGFSNYAAVKFTDHASQDYSLESDSPAKAAGSDGYDVGVHNYALHQAALAGVTA